MNAKQEKKENKRREMRRGRKGKRYEVEGRRDKEVRGETRAVETEM